MTDGIHANILQIIQEKDDPKCYAMAILMNATEQLNLQEMEAAALFEIPAPTFSEWKNLLNNIEDLKKSFLEFDDFLYLEWQKQAAKKESNSYWIYLSIKQFEDLYLHRIMLPFFRVIWTRDIENVSNAFHIPLELAKRWEEAAINILKELKESPVT